MNSTFLSDFLCEFYLPIPFIFLQTLTPIIPELAVANAGSCVGPQNK